MNPRTVSFPCCRRALRELRNPSRLLAWALGMFVIVAHTAPAVRAQQTVVANYSAHSLVVLDLSNGNRTILSNSSTGTGTMFASPVGIAREADGNILVGENVSDAKVIRIDPTTGDRTLVSHSSRGTGPTLSNVYGLAVDASGYIIASSYGTSSVVRIDPATGNRTVLGSATVGTGPLLNGAWGVAVEPDGNIVVAVYSAAALIRLNPNTLERTTLSAIGVGTGANLVSPTGIARLSDGSLAVVNYGGTDYIVRVDAATGNRTVVSGTTLGLGPTIGARYAVSFDSTGQIYTADFSGNAIVRIDPATGDRTTIASSTVGSGPSLSSPLGILPYAVASVTEPVAPTPTITSATYDASAGALAVTASDMTSGDTIAINKLTLTGEGGVTYTLTTADVTASSATAFSVTLNATDKAAVNAMLNKNGTASTGGTTYNLAAADDWDASVTGDDSADATGNGVTVSNVAVPTITSATYSANTGSLVVTGTGFLSRSGATNDIVANKFTFTGEGGATYTLTDTASVEITSGTSFTLTLSSIDQAAVNLMQNKNGTSSTGGTTYNLAAAEDWAAGADAAVAVADTTGNGVTVSNVAIPTIVSATYDASTGALVVTGAHFSTSSGAANDVVAAKFTITGQGGATRALSDTANVEITSGTSFTLMLGSGDRTAVNLLLKKNGASSLDGTTYNLAAAEDWAAGADAAVAVADPTENGISVSNADSTPPTITAGRISISGGSGTSGAFKIGDTVTATWNNTAGGDNNSDVASVTVDFSQFGGGAAVAATNSSGTWTATYTIVAGALDATNRNVSITATDTTSNSATTSDDTNATVDNSVPTVSDSRISISGASGTNGVFKIGDTVTATWNNTAGGDNNADTVSSVTVDFSAFGGGAAVAATNSSGTWSATYAIVAGAIDATNRNVSVTATDNAGNVTTTADTTNASVDTIAPTVTDAGIALAGASGMGGAFKIGDTVTATWNNTASGDNNPDTIAGVTVDFSGFGGGAALVATNNSGTWVATYTIVAGALDAANRNVSVTVTDNAGNTTTAADTKNATVDNEAPTVSDANISLSGASGPNGVFKIGDIVTATWNNTAGGDNNADTIASVSIDFSAFGGGAAVAAGNSSGIWTATYTVAAGALDAADLNVSATVTDNAGNATTLADTTNATVDNIAPGAPSTPDLDANSDSGVSSTDDITADTTPTFSGTAAADATVTLLKGSTVLGTAVATDGNWTITSSALAEGVHAIYATATDEATNVSVDSGALTITIDTSAPITDAIVRANPLTVNADGHAVTWRVAFDAGVSGVDVADFVLTVVQGDATGTIAAVTAIDASNYDIAVNAVGGHGLLRLDLNGSGTGIADLAGNALVDGGFATGDFYIVGVTNVFDTVGLAAGTTRSVAGVTTNQVAQRFTTAAAAPLSVTTVTAWVGSITGTPAPVVTIHADNAGRVGAMVTTLTNPNTLVADMLNVWTSTKLLDANTTYWVVFADTSDTGAYEIEETAATSGGAGSWLGATDYAYLYGANASSGPQAGALRIALGATNLPAITSELTATGGYGSAFAYTIAATNAPLSFAATGLPGGLNVNATTGEITGVPTQTGTFNVVLTGTNASGTGVPSTLVLSINPAPLTATAASALRSYGESNPAFTINYTGFVNGDTAASLLTRPTAASTATAASNVGAYAITVTGGSSPNYTISGVDGVLTIVPAAQSITFGAIGSLIIGDTLTLSATASSGLPVSLSVVSGPASLSGGTLTATGVGAVTVRASQTGNGNYNAAAPVDRSFAVTVGPASVTTPQQVPTPPSGGTAQLEVVDANPNVSYRWQRNGAEVAGATGPTLTLSDAQPPVAGLYTYTASVPGGGAGVSEPVVVGIATTEKVIGSGEEVGTDILHPNGNTYDQLLLEGAATTFTANAGQVTRLSFVDMTNDIVQVELSGAGTLSLVMDNASEPALAQNYNQPGVAYVRGHAGIVITGADESTNVTVFSVGRANAVNQALFSDDVEYDGMADLAFIAIQSTNGKFGGVHTGNVNYYATQGFTGVYAPGVTLSGALNIGEISAFDAATPVIVVGSANQARITGGNLAQSNGALVRVDGVNELRFVDGTTSHGGMLPAQPNQGVIGGTGVNGGATIVVNP